VLVGATATGKTALAQRLAEERHAVILSADAMLVYRGLDIGTAKPTAAERGRVRYGGLDLVNPDAEFHVAAWLDHAREFLAAARAAGQPVIVVGGTGLYVKCLLRGLTEQPAADRAWRVAAETMSRAALQEQLQRRAPARYAALTESDRQNPRRLIRALELAREVPDLGKPNVPAFQPWEQPAPIVGLRLPPALLAERIRTRVAAMFEQGLVDEARRLRAAFPQLSATARQAIGYAEAFAVLDGTCTEAAAREKIALRTRQLAKRQMTWFRHQVHTAWIEGDDGAAQRVREFWSTHGPTPLAY
jgi:tRNA dimethylallyltransferase